MKISETAEQLLVKYRNTVWHEVNSYLKEPKYPKTFKIISKYQKINRFHWDMVRDYPERKGKYLRPALLILACEAMGESSEYALKTAAAMQISEEWLLIHDDFEDNSEMRRGQKTLHKKYSSELAVNAGDALHMLMWKILSDNYYVLGGKKTAKLIDEFYLMLARTACGQTAEIKWSQDRQLNLSDEDWFFIADGKTSYYTIAGPLRLGAIVANANKKEVDSLTEFGLWLGRCFQLADDLLDLTSNFRGLKGKKGGDIWEGKRTVMLGHLYRNAGKKDRQKLISVYKKDRSLKKQADTDWVLQKMQEYGSIRYGKNLVEQLKNRALEIFDSKLVFLTGEPRKKLQKLIYFIAERDH